MSDLINKDEKALRALLDQSTDFEERRKIRAALRDLRNKRFKTVNIYETPSVSTIGNVFTENKITPTSDSKSDIAAGNIHKVVETQRPAEEAIFHSPVTERVHIVRKTQSFKTDRDVHTVSSSSGVQSKSAARHFLSSHLAVLAVNGSDSASSSDHVKKAFGVSGNPAGRSQSFKLLASKFENNNQATGSEGYSSPGLSASHNGSFKSLQGSSQIKNASTAVETDQVNQVVTVGRAHSLKLPSNRDLSHHSDAPPIGSLAHSYSEKKAMRLMSGSDPNINRLGNNTNRTIRPFTKHNGVTAVTTTDRAMSSPHEDHMTTDLSNEKSLYSSSSLPMPASVEQLRGDASVHRSGSLHSSSSKSPLLTASEVTKVKRTGSLRNAPLKSGGSQRIVWRNSSPANIQEYLESTQNSSGQEEKTQEESCVNNINSTSSVDVSLNLSRSSAEFTPDSQLNTSGEERLAQKVLEKSKGLNKYEDIQDEELLSQMLKEAADLDERINIRAALHKLRQNHVGDRVSHSSPTRRKSEDMGTKGQQVGFKTKLEQNKAALESLMHLNENQSLTTNTSCDLETTSNSSFLSTQPSNLEEEVFSSSNSHHHPMVTTLTTASSSLDTSAKSSDSPPTDYFSIENENQLQNLLNQTADYFERKKIRSALTTLKRRQSLAEIDRLKERTKSLRTSPSKDHHASKRHSYHGDGIIRDSISRLDAILDTGQSGKKRADQHKQRRKTTATEYPAQNEEDSLTRNIDEEVLNHTEVVNNNNELKTSSLVDNSRGSQPGLESGQIIKRQEKAARSGVKGEYINRNEPGGKKSVSTSSTSTTNNVSDRTSKVSLSRSNAVRGKRLKSYNTVVESNNNNKKNSSSRSSTSTSGSVESKQKHRDKEVEGDQIEELGKVVGVVGGGGSLEGIQLDLKDSKSVTKMDEGKSQLNLNEADDVLKRDRIEANCLMNDRETIQDNIEDVDDEDRVILGRCKDNELYDVGAVESLECEPSDGNIEQISRSKLNSNPLDTCDESSTRESGDISGDRRNISESHVADRQVELVNEMDMMNDCVQNDQDNMGDNKGVITAEDINRNYSLPEEKSENDNLNVCDSLDIQIESQEIPSNFKSVPSLVTDDVTERLTSKNDEAISVSEDFELVTSQDSLIGNAAIASEYGSQKDTKYGKDQEEISLDIREVDSSHQLDKPGEESPEKAVKTLDELRDELDQFEKELQHSNDFDRRRELRSEIRKIRVLIRDGDFILKTPRFIDPGTSSSALQPVTIDFTETENNSHLNTRNIPSKESLGSKEASPENKDKVKNKVSRTKDFDIVDTPVKENGSATIEKIDTVDDLEVIQMGNAEVKEENGEEGYIVVEIVDGQVKTDDLNKVIERSNVDSLDKDRYMKDGQEVVDDHVVVTKIQSSQNKDAVVIENKRNGKAVETVAVDVVPEVTSPLTDLIAVDGESCNLSCHVTAPNDADVIWFRENMVLKDTPEFKQTRDGSLLNMLIREVFPDDEGAYRCLVKSAKGEAETSCYLLVKENKMAILPAFTTVLQDTSAVGGDSVTLKCEVTGKPLPHIYWYYRDMMLKNHPDVKQDFIAGWATLTIPQVICGDSGQYSCVAKNAAGEVKCHSTLTVTDNSPEGIAEEAPTVNMTTNDLDLNEGDCMTLVCQVTGSPNPSIVWKKDESGLQSSENCRLDFVYGQASLVIYKVLPSDAGSYSCVARNSAGEAGVSVIVSVRAKPKPSKLPTPQNSSHQHSVISNRLSSSQSNLSSKAGQNEKYLNSKNEKLTKSRDRLNSGSRERLHSLTKDKKKIGSKERLNSASTESLKSASRERLNSGSKERRKFGSKERLQSSSSDKHDGFKSGLILDKSQAETKDSKAKPVAQESLVRTSSVVVTENKTKLSNSKTGGGIEPPRILTALPEIYEVNLDQYMCLECRFNYLSQNTEVKWIKDRIHLPKVGRIKWTVEKACTRLWINSVSKGDVGIYEVVISNAGGEVRSQTDVRFKVGPTLRSKLQPKQVSEKASSLLHNVLGNMMKQDPSDGNQATQSNQLRSQVKLHREQNHSVPPPSSGTKQFHSYLGGSEKFTSSTGERKTEERGTAQSTMSSTKNIQDMEDEEELHKLMNNTDNFDERRKIRARLREIREQKSAEYEKARRDREKNHEDAVQLKIRQAQADKERKLKQFDDVAKQTKTGISVAEEGIRQKHADADAARAKKLEDMKQMAKVTAKSYNIDSASIQLDKRAEKDAGFSEDSVTRSTRTEGVPGGSMTTQVTTTTSKTKDGSTVTTKQTKQTTQTGGIGGTSYKITKTSADNFAKRFSDSFSNKASDGTSGMIKVKTESWSSKDGITRRNEKTKSWGGSTAATKSNPMDRFKQMDNANNPQSSRPNGGGGRVAIQRSPSAIKQLLLEWVKRQVDGYDHVNVTNFSSSWNDGMAFCALIHHFYPEAFDFSKLDPKKRKGNFTLAFKVAEKLADIAPLLDVEDMVRMKNPDWKCVFTYVQSFYQKLRNREVNQDS